MASNVSSVYIHVIDDVISKVRDEFINYGVEENVLNELQALWETKMMECGAVSGNGMVGRPSIQRAPGLINSVHDLNVPYEGSFEEFETPTAEMLFPPTPLQTPIQTPLPGLADQTFNIPTGPTDFNRVNDARNNIDIKAGRPSPYMQPPSPWMNQRPLGVDVNVAYEEGRDEVARGVVPQHIQQDILMMPSAKRKRDDHASQLASGDYMPQQDGSGDVSTNLILPEITRSNSSTRCSQETATCEPLSNEGKNAVFILPQHDGIHDGYDDFRVQGVPNEEYVSHPDRVELRVGTPFVGTPKPTESGALDDEEPPLNEDDDEDLDELDQEEEEPSTQHLVLSQFDKVSRTKSRWRCTLLCGIMHLNNRDILFNKANGEFDF